MRRTCLALTLALIPAAGVADNAIIAAFRQASHSSNASVRASAARALCDFDDAGARAELLRLVKDESEVVATAAAEALGKCGGKEARAALVTLLTEESARIEAGQSGVVFQAEVKVPAQLQALRAEANAGRILRAMGHSQDPVIADVVLKTGLGAKSLSTRIAAVMALGRLKTPTATQPLMAILEDYYAALPAGSGGDVIDPGGMKSKIPDAEQMVYLRSSVCWALEQIGDKAALPLLQRATKDVNSLVRDAATEAVNRIQGR